MKSSLEERRVYKLPGDIRDELCMSVLFLALADVSVRAPVEDVLRCTDATPSGYGACETECPPKLMRALYRLGRHRGEHVRLDWADTQAPWLPSRMPKADAATNALFEQLAWRVSGAGHFRKTAHINLQETRALKAELKSMILRSPETCKLHRRSVIGVDSRVLCGAGMKGRSSSYRLNGILRTVTGLLVSFRIAIALPWIATGSNPADHPSRQAKLPPPAARTSEIAEILESAGYSDPKPTVRNSRRLRIPAPVRAPTGSGCALPTLAELKRRIDLALGGCGERMQENVCSQQLRRCYQLPTGVAESAFERAGGFRELFAGAGGICRDLSRRGDDRCVAYEAYPESKDDSGLKATAYLPEFDILCPMVLLSLLLDIYKRVVTRVHMGPPCQTWGGLFQNMGPGTRSPELWEGLCQDIREVLGNRTMGASVLILRAIWEVMGIASLEHPLASRIWGLKSVRGLLGLPGVCVVRIDQCAFGLRPGDDVTKKLRYLKPTRLLLVGSGSFDDHRCNGKHSHVQILGNYRIQGSEGKMVTVRRSQEAGCYPDALCHALGTFHRSERV